MKQLNIFDELDLFRDDQKMVEKHYLNEVGEVLPWEQEDHSHNCKNIIEPLDKLSGLVL